MASKFLSWLTTKNGRRFTHVTVGVIVTSVVGVKVAIHGPLLGKYQELFQLYHECEPQPLPAHVLSTAETVVKDCKISEDEKNKIKFFSVIGHEVFHAGGRNFFWGAIIGIPFTFLRRGEIDIFRLKLFHDDLDWVTEGQDFLDVLHLNDNAKKFAIAREIYASDIISIFERALLPAICILFPARTSQLLNAKRNAFSSPLKRRLFIYFFYYSMSFALYLCCKTIYTYVFSKQCDENAAKTGPDYLEGGIEFYSKTLEKNKELRRLLGFQGKSAFTEEGNIKTLFPDFKITDRLANLQRMKDENTHGESS